MDYREKYEQALENLKRIKKANRDNKELVDFIEYQYPELKESEDERIKKELSDFIHWTIDRGSITKEQREQSNSWLAWLEKQGEQTPVKWSEEDEDALDIAIRIIQNGGDDCAGILDSDKAFKWLKSLKQRMKGETK